MHIVEGPSGGDSTRENNVKHLKKKKNYAHNSLNSTKDNVHILDYG